MMRGSFLASTSSTSDMTKNDEAKASSTNFFLMRNHQEISSETKLISRKLRYASNQERVSLISKFNEKWGKWLEMTCVIDIDAREARWKVIDRGNKGCTLEGGANNIKIDPDQNANQISTSNDALVSENSSDRIEVIDSDAKTVPNDRLLIENKKLNLNNENKISSATPSFWRRKLPVAATALAVVVAASAAVSMMARG